MLKITESGIFRGKISVTFDCINYTSSKKHSFHYCLTCKFNISTKIFQDFATKLKNPKCTKIVLSS